MDCYNCKAKSVCAAVVQPGSVICLMNRMRYCGTHAEEEPRRQQGDYTSTTCGGDGKAVRLKGGKHS